MENKQNIIKKIENLIEKTDALKSQLDEIKSELIKSDFSNQVEITESKKTEIATEVFTPITFISAEAAPIENKTNIELNAILEDTATDSNNKKESASVPHKSPKNKGDFEKFIGENLINKIGIAVLVIGIGFFIKYAIDQNWINEYGRVIIGALAGIALIALAFKMRKTFRPFSSVLGGGGIAVLYFSATLAFREYGILSQEVAFVFLILISIGVNSPPLCGAKILPLYE